MYEFYVGDEEVRERLADAVERGRGGTENMVEIVYQPQTKFRVQSVTHCTSSIPGVCVCMCVCACACACECVCVCVCE